MSMTAAALIGSAALSSAAQYAINSANIKNQRSINDASISLANTQHQREVADLRLAGLNPILSANGSGASVPALGTPALDSVVKDLPTTARELGRYVSDQYRESVTGQQLSNDYQQIVNSAAESERSASAIRADNDRMQAEAERDALEEVMGTHRFYNGRHVTTTFDQKEYDRYKELLKQGIQSDAKLRSNANWRSNLSSFVPFTAPIANSASKYGFPGAFKRIGWFK